MGISTEQKSSSDDGVDNVEDGNAVNEIDYEQLLAEIGFGKTQWILLLISGLLTVTSIAAQISVGIIAIASQCEFRMNQVEKGVMMAACVAGVFLSTYFWGYVSDAIGRRTVLLYGTFVTNLLQFVTMFVTNIWLFNLINFILGISLGGVSAAIYAYLSEFNLPKYRAVVINYSTMFVSVAAIYVPATAWLVLSAEWSYPITDEFAFRPWRLIIMLNLLPGFIGGLMLLPFPESPKLLLAQHKEREAKFAIEWISYSNLGHLVQSIKDPHSYSLKAEVLDEDDVLVSSRKGCAIFISIWKATIPLLQKPHRKNFLISVIIVFCLFFSSSGMQVWYPEIVNRLAGEAGNDNSSSTVCEILNSSFQRQASSTIMESKPVCNEQISTKTYIDNMIVGLAFLLGFIIQGGLLNPVGRKNVLLGALVIGALSGILLHLVTNATIVLILFCLYILMPGLSISIMCGAVVDLVPTYLRGKAVSICFSFGRLGVIIATNVIAVMLEPLCNSTFAIFTAAMIVSAGLVRYLPI